MRGYSEQRFYDFFTDGMASRISMFDAHGREFFMKIPQARPGKSRREAREAALDAINEAIESGLEPGEVRIVQ